MAVGAGPPTAHKMALATDPNALANTAMAKVRTVPQAMTIRAQALARALPITAHSTAPMDMAAA